MSRIIHRYITKIYFRFVCMVRHHTIDSKIRFGNTFISHLIDNLYDWSEWERARIMGL